MGVIVAVDGGGSGCRLAAFDHGGRILAATSLDLHASLSLGSEQAWHHIEQGLQQLQQLLGQPRSWMPERLMMGLAGSLQNERRAVFRACMPTSLPCYLCTDGHAQLMGASGGRPAACLAIGTGSVLHWLDEQGQQGMAGGWGFPAGDEGSGAWLGMRLLQVYLWHRDGRRQPGDLMPAMEGRVGTDVSAIQLWSTQYRSGIMAQLAPLVFEYADKGDELALLLLDEAVSRCMELLALAPSSLPVYIVGGIGDLLRARLSEQLQGRVAIPEGDALHGLFLLSRQTVGEST